MRTYYVAGTSHCLLNPDGTVNQRERAAMAARLDRSDAEPVPMVAIQQKAGQMVLFRNTVCPAYHAVADHTSSRGIEKPTRTILLQNLLLDPYSEHFTNNSDD